MQTLKVFKKQFQILICWKYLGTKTQINGSCKLLTDISINVFRNYILHKTKKFDYKTPQWMNTLIISALKKNWDYKNADTKSIQKTISNFDLFQVFRNKNANESCKLLTDILINVFRNYIPHKTKKVDYKTL